jgi:hypothetical protein
MRRRIVSRCTAGSFLVATKRLTHVVQKTIPKLSFLVVILLWLLVLGCHGLKVLGKLGVILHLSNH